MVHVCDVNVGCVHVGWEQALVSKEHDDGDGGDGGA